MTSRFSSAITDQIRQASDIVDVVSSYVTLKRAGATFKGLCPFHKEKTPSFTVNPQRQIFKCFGCGAGGDIFKFIQQREGVGFPEARAILANRAGISIADEESPSKQPIGAPSKVELERVNRWACRWFQYQLASPLGQSAREYLERRGASRDSIAKYELGFAPESWDALIRGAAAQKIPSPLLLGAGLIKQNSGVNNIQSPYYDAFRNRIIFPIKDVIGRIIGFGGRALGDDPAKYLNSPQNGLFDKGRSLYGLSIAKDAFREKPVALIVEGYMDCLIAQQYGFANAVATLGTALTVEHVRLLRRYVDAVILVFDSDLAGQKAADRALEIFLSEQIDVKVATGSEAKDPADLLLAYGASAFEQVLTSAIDALEYKWKQVLSRYRNDTTGPGRRRAIEEFLRLIAQTSNLNSQDPIQRGLILNQITKLLGIPSQEVYRQLGIVARRMPASSAEEAMKRGAATTTPTTDATSKALEELLGVLLNEPSYYASISSVFEPAWIVDPVVREIAEEVASILEEGTSFSLAELIGRFESLETAARITALQAGAEARGNYAATLEGAVVCLNRARAQKQLVRLDSTLRQASVPAEGREPDAAENENPIMQKDHATAQAHNQALKQAQHFAARRHWATTLVPSPASETASEIKES